jgi:hypothetical protein
MLKSFLKRFREPSSWAGIAVAAGVFGVPAASSAAVVDALAAVTAATGGSPLAIAQAVVAITSAVAVFLPEEKPPLLIVKGQA